jgi:signal transduction histidine kinase
VPKSQSLLLPSSDILDRAFRSRAKKAAELFLPLKRKIDRQFVARLRRLGFDNSQSALLVAVTPGAALEAIAGGGDMRRFLKNAAGIGSQLAKRNLHPNRIAAALREYGAAAAEISKNLPAAAASDLKPIFERLQFAITLTLNNASYGVRESETKALFDLYGASADVLDAYAVLRNLIESLAAFFGASAGHVFLFDAPKNSWELKASTAVAVSPEAEASIAASPSLNRKLKTPEEISTGRVRSILLLDPGWNSQWTHCWSVPIRYGGETTAIVQLAFSETRTMFPRDLELISIAGQQSLANAKRTRMIEGIAEREQQMFDLARRMLQVEEIERRRISRELHDDAGQSLVVIRLQMEMIETSMPPDAEWRERLAEARDLTEQTILHMRRLIADLSPAVLEQLGVAAGLRQLANRLRQAHGCKVHLHIGKLPPLYSDFQIIVYRLAQECLSNISQHSQATRVNVSVTVADRVLRLRVEDDGIGFHVEEGLSKKHCFGLVGMRERVTLLGGNCQIRSTAKGGDVPVHAKKTGTEIDIQLPIPLNSPSSFT